MPLKNKRMKVEKFKVLLYLKKSGLDKFGKAPIMGRITVNNTMAQFSCKLSCTPELWNPRESRLNGKSKEAVDINAKIDRLLLSVNSAFDSLVDRKIDFDAVAVKELLQGSVETQMTLLKRLDMHIEDMRSRIGIDVAKTSMSTYVYTRRYLGEYIQKRFKTSDVAFGQLNEHIPWEFQDYILKDKGLAVDTARHYLAILKKICRMAFKEGYAEKRYFENFKLPQENRKPPRALSREDFEKIRDVVIPPERITHNIARDLFLFACYTGVPYADAVSITDYPKETAQQKCEYCKSNGLRCLSYVHCCCHFGCRLSSSTILSILPYNILRSAVLSIALYSLHCPYWLTRNVLSMSEKSNRHPCNGIALLK